MRVGVFQIAPDENESSGPPIRFSLLYLPFLTIQEFVDGNDGRECSFLETEVAQIFGVTCVGAAQERERASCGNNASYS